ncbi:MAG: MFS transporter [Desulfobacterales bacterium]|jgi:NNP family nitrate/nitrite transporter-like MFS transporter|nr:MFS transporter [Desulfobacterales bacterium]
MKPARSEETDSTDPGMRLEPFRTLVGPLLLLTTIFFLNFMARIIQAPLMPAIEAELGISHGAAGSLFFTISIGYFISLMGSGFVSARLQHRGVIVLSSLLVGLILLVIAASSSLWTIRGSLVVLGLAAGLYLPSGIATLTGFVGRPHWGKAIAIHELAPNLSFVAAPLFAEAVLIWFSWRGALVLLGAATVLITLVFASRSRAGDFAGEAPNFRSLSALAGAPSFWLMVLLFSLGISSTLGIYTMLPLYLVNEHGFERDFANTVVAFSRLIGLVMALVGGWVTDRFGPKRTLGIVFLLTGGFTLMLGLSPTPWVSAVVFMQPMVAVCFFPAGFAALGMVVPPSARNIAVSFTTPMAFMIGAGVVPTLIGVIGDIWSFGLGVSLVGGLILAGAFLPRFLKVERPPETL